MSDNFGRDRARIATKNKKRLLPLRETLSEVVLIGGKKGK